MENEKNENKELNNVSEETDNQQEESPQEEVQQSGNEPKEEEANQDVENQNEEQHEHDEDEDEFEAVDYTKYSKKELVDLIKELAKEGNIRKSDRVLKEIKPLYDEMLSQEKQEALDKFVADGGDSADFEYKLDELDLRFDANYQLIKDRKQQFFKEQEKQREENLRKKNEVLDKLRNLVDGEESDTSISALKQLQEEWKAIGQVAPQHVKSLWANYNILIDRFYDNRSIHFELKELDRKKNLEAKLELCEKAETLAQNEDVSAAIRELNTLHEEFKHIGPVPKDHQEDVWQRFKAASDKVYDKRKEYVKDLKKVLDANLIEKQALVDKVKPFTEFSSDRIKQWNQKTKEILDLQKQWEAIGGLPRDAAKEINKSFWNSFKKFFNNKQNFFKELEKQRDVNLEKKKELVAQAKSLQDSTDWDKTAEAMKKLQRSWKEIGPVPEKYRDAIYEEFKSACDAFFSNMRSESSGVEKEYQENLERKETICLQIEELAKNEPNNIDKLSTLEEEYSEIGFVPRSHVKTIKERFTKAVEKFLEVSTNLSDGDKAKVKLMTQLTKMKAGPNANRKLNQKEFSIRKKITDLQNDITLWKNNLEFFASSKTADKLKEEFDAKITEAQHEIKKLKEQLKIVRSM